MLPPNGSEEERLNRLFQAYREAFPEIEPSANFMPEVWQRIENRQSFTYAFRRLAGGFVTAAMALTLAMAVYLALPSNNSAFYSQSYIETLADSHTLDNLETFDLLRTDAQSESGHL
ncbi:MAG: hypothetical protein M1541_17295 [Acidobacteria bacterium]|nr:hypothetical protein [Acidobacteriota bacterium]